MLQARKNEACEGLLSPSCPSPNQHQATSARAAACPCPHPQVCRPSSEEWW